MTQTKARRRSPGVTRGVVSIRKMKPSDAASIARLHAAAIELGFLSRLGPNFLASLYQGISESEGSHVFVADDGGDVLGFCAYTRDVDSMYRDVLGRRWGRLLVAVFLRLLDPRLAKEVWDTLRYPTKQAAQHLPPAEILSIAVSEGSRGGGVGRLLLEQALHQAALDGQREIKVLAGAELGDANRFYEQCGFTVRSQMIQHGKPLNVYVRALPRGVAADPAALGFVA